MVEKQPAISESTVETNPSFLTPMCDMTFSEIKREKPEIAQEMRIILEEIDRQAVENLSVYDSKIYPGISFTYTKLSLTPELIDKIGQTNSSNTEQSNEHRITVSFGVFSPPPDGHALNPLDIATDRFIRNIPRLTQALKKGTPYPQIDIYTLGTPLGFGGKVTREWIDSFKRNGFETTGKMYAEFVNGLIDEDIKNTHLLLQGASMGAINADKTLKNLAPNLKDKTQVLLDVPAGHHGTLKGIQTAVGLGAETAIRIAVDRRIRGEGKKKKKLFEYLEHDKNILPDDKNQTNLKRQALLALSLRLVKGTPLEKDQREFVRKGLFDPLTTGPLRIAQSLMDSRHPINIRGTNRSLERPVATTHFWFYTQRFERWKKAIEYAQSKK